MQNHWKFIKIIKKTPNYYFTFQTSTFAPVRRLYKKFFFNLFDCSLASCQFKILIFNSTKKQSDGKSMSAVGFGPLSPQRELCFMSVCENDPERTNYVIVSFADVGALRVLVLTIS